MMNRIRTALNLKEGEYTGEYVEKLERVYEVLEKCQKNNEEYINKILKIHAEEVNVLAMRNNELEKALDKACEQLAMNEEATTLFNEYHDKEQWKEWALKDE